MDIKEIRADIDKTDEELTKLLVHRMELAGQVAKYKAENNKAVHDGLREREVIKNVMTTAGKPFDQFMPAIFNAIMDASKAYQHQLLDSDDR